MLQDEIERARVSFLAAMCQLLGEGVRKRGQVHAGGLSGGDLVPAGGAGLVGWGTSSTTMHCEDFSIRVAPPFNAVQLHNPWPTR